MKTGLLLLSILFCCKAFSQSPEESKILQLSSTMFSWEVKGNIDSLTALFDDRLSVVTSRGDIQSKEQYLKTLSNGNFKHDSIDVEQNIATIKGSTATVIGKGRFVMTLNGSQLRRHLSFMEVFTKDDKYWKLLALYASVLPD